MTANKIKSISNETIKYNEYLWRDIIIFISIEAQTLGDRAHLNFYHIPILDY